MAIKDDDDKSASQWTIRYDDELEKEFLEIIDIMKREVEDKKVKLGGEFKRSVYLRIIFSEGLEKIRTRGWLNYDS